MKSRPGLLRARDYLAANFNERISLADAAALAGLSPFYFHRLFADTFSETPHEFVTRLRIDHAKSFCWPAITASPTSVSTPATKAWVRLAPAFTR
jgi:transcriptional regulator GlxA family with amidase domain